MDARKRSRAAAALAAGLLLLSALAAAGQAPTNPPPPESGSEDASTLLLGIVRLQGTGNAVSAQQGEQLLALVQAWRIQMERPPAGPTGSSPQPGEVPGGQPLPSTSLADGIRAVLTSVQWQAIVAMALTGSDVMQWIGPPASGDSMPPSQGSPQGPPPATPPAPGGSAPGAQPSGGGPQENPMVRFADAVIELLTSWAAP